jgi:hypothetical protein
MPIFYFGIFCRAATQNHRPFQPIKAVISALLEIKFNHKSAKILGFSGP